jgi:NAD-dependent dihydropyrimidine dehydrogenase PreA subunit
MREKKKEKKVSRYELLSTGWVVTDFERCVQCGICSYNCPAGIDVRQYSWLGRPIEERRCITCAQCVARCPRGALYFARLPDTTHQT